MSWNMVSRLRPGLGAAVSQRTALSLLSPQLRPSCASHTSRVAAHRTARAIDRGATRALSCTSYRLAAHEPTPTSATPEAASLRAGQGGEEAPTGPAGGDRSFPPAWLRIALVVAAAGGALWGFYSWARSRSGDLPLAQYLLTGRELNAATFVPYTIVAREPVTDDSFVLTLRPRHRTLGALSSSASRFHAKRLDWLSEWSPWRRLTDAREHSNGRVYGRAWAHGVWAVEVKQPQLQIVREYTPLPPLPPPPAHSAVVQEGHGGVEDPEEAGRRYGDLRFLVRTVGGGEVSNYLSRLRLGSIVELRGPHLGFDVKRRLGISGGGGGEEGEGEEEEAAAEKKVVFLAGGTGIAPALQVAHALLDDGGAAGGSGSSGGKNSPSVSILWANRQRGNLAESSPVVRQLEDMAKRHGARFSLQTFVDDDKKFIDDKAIKGVVLPPKGAPAAAAATTKSGESGCQYHSEAQLQRTATDPPADEGGVCRCHASPAGAGKDLIFVSGPDGFIKKFAGEKVWKDKLELQGPVGGLLGDLKRKNPDKLSNWLILKL